MAIISKNSFNKMLELYLGSLLTLSVTEIMDYPFNDVNRVVGEPTTLVFLCFGNIVIDYFFCIWIDFKTNVVSLMFNTCNCGCTISHKRIKN